MNTKPEVVPPIHHDESAEHAIRVQKVHDMQQEGLQPWPEYKPVSVTTAQALTEFAKSADETKEYSMAGRLMSLRDHGKTFFAHLQDRSGQIQLYIKKDALGDAVFAQFKKYIDVGDQIFARGTLFTTKKGEVTLDAQEIILLSKCLHPLPEKYHGLADVEQRYRQRHLDLISSPEAREKFRKRSTIVQNIRNFLQSKDFIEVETPMLHAIPGGAAARPFTTHHNAYDMDLYLRIAPELFLKRLVVGGFERVFEINRNFRNEGVSTRHNPEFTMLEFYMAHGDYDDGMALVEELIKSGVVAAHGTTSFEFQGKTISVETPFKRLTVEQALIEIGSLSAAEITPNAIDATMKRHNITLPGKPGYGMKLFGLFEELVESKIVQPTFITGYPLEVSPLAKKDPKNPELTARAELFIVGMEFANLFTELNDPIDQAQRFQQQANARSAGDDEAHYFDADFVKALEYGLPPTVGVGIGIDRLIMLLTNTSTIKDVILFPTLKIAK
ncbi:lysine--tRNA ligase [Candidatus Dependentiae bacterium]|nr:lysine--tRNA ligase [Candidatus Dependentiae bacterium]